MPSDSIAGFLDQAQASRVLFPEQVEQLIRQPDIPQSNLDALCEYLESRGALTRFQADMLRQGRGHELSFAGYPVLDEIGPCPGGTAYRALHPSLRTPVELRRFRTDALLPADNPAALVQRARAAAELHHPNLVPLLDAGMYGDEGYAAIDVPADAATLDGLVRDIGPMPGFLAAEYGRQVAAALRSAHERGMWHGDVQPANLFVGPMTVKTSADGVTKRRPAPNAAARVAAFGLVPVRPPAEVAPPPADVLPYLPPERADTSGFDPRGDLYGLGATLYYLLAGRPPVTGNSPEELLHNVRTAEPAPLAALRPDIPTDLAAVVHHLLARRPEDRLSTAFDAEVALARFCRPGTVPAVPDVPAAIAVPVGHAEVVPADSLEAHPAPAYEWGAADPGEDFSTAHAATGPVRRARTGKDKARTRLMVVLGLLLHLTAVALFLAAFVFKVFDSEPEPQPVPTQPEPKKSLRTSDPRP